MRPTYYFSSDNHPNHLCFCGLFHVRTAVFILCIIQLICLSYAAISVPLAYTHITRETWNVVSISFLAMTFIGGVTAAITLLGLVGEHSKLLVPQILWLIVSGFLSCVLVTVTAVAMIEGGWLAFEVLGSQRWVINWEGFSQATKIAVAILIMLLGNMIIIVVSVWLVKIVVKCTRFIREKVEFEQRMLQNLPRREEEVPINANEPHY